MWEVSPTTAAVHAGLPSIELLGITTLTALLACTLDSTTASPSFQVGHTV